MIDAAKGLSHIAAGKEWTLVGDPQTAEEFSSALLWSDTAVPPSWHDVVAAAQLAEVERQEAEAVREAARVSARARLAAQGWTDVEIDVTYPTLVASS